MKIQSYILLLQLIRSAVSQSIITGLTLINSATDEDIRALKDQDVIDLNVYSGIQLTIRADVDSGAVIDQIEFDLDDETVVRTEDTTPFFLGGDSEGDADAVNTLQVTGRHTLTVTALVNGASVDVLSIVFFITDSSLSEETTPTTTPVSIYDVPGYESSSDGEVKGELKKWHKITIGFSGRPTAETNNIANPFTDFRLDVTFTHSLKGKQYVVPGFYACDGNAANTGEFAGYVWLVHFRPDETGNWTYTANFTQGINVAVNETAGESASFFDGANGSFIVEDTDKMGRDLRGKGRLQYVGEHHLQFAETGEYFLKAGADSPENFLAYSDFDNTPNNGGYLKDWAPHAQDYVDGDPTWMGGKGRAIIGAVNYLSSTGMNVFSFLTMNIEGDDKNVFPYISDQPEHFDRMDCSKTAQWDVVFDHAETKGMFLHFKTQETENDQLLDGGELGNSRKLYYRELIARFGHHLALNWNLGEENTNTDVQRKAFANYFKEIDPYDHPVVMHTYPGTQEENYEPLLGYQTFDGVSLQTGQDAGYSQTLQWVTRSAAAGRKWIVSFDEQAPADSGVVPDADDPTHDGIRKNVLWANLMAGGSGVEYYFGYSYDNSDLSLQDFRSREAMWNQSRHALEFFASVPFWKMVNATERVTNNNWCLMERDNGAVIVLYLPLGGSADIDLTGLSEIGSSFSIHWYDPRLGGEMQNGSTASIAAGSSGSIGDAPFSLDQDWAVMLKCTDCQTEQPTPDPVPTSTPIAQTSLAPIFQTTPAPVGQTTPSPVSQTTPAPFVQSTPAPFSQETLAPAAAQETPAPFALQTTPAPAQSKSAPAASPMTTGTPAVPVLQTTNVPAAGDTPPSLFVAATTQASPMPTRSAAGGLSSSLLTACLAFSVLLC